MPVRAESGGSETSTSSNRVRSLDWPTARGRVGPRPAGRIFPTRVAPELLTDILRMLLVAAAYYLTARLSLRVALVGVVGRGRHGRAGVRALSAEPSRTPVPRRHAVAPAHGGRGPVRRHRGGHPRGLPDAHARRVSGAPLHGMGGLAVPPAGG